MSTFPDLRARFLPCGHPVEYRGQRIIPMEQIEFRVFRQPWICRICEHDPPAVRDYASQLLGEVPIEGSERIWAEAIVKDPNDITPRLVFADWLDERGDPRGELIRIEQELEKKWPNLKEDVRDLVERSYRIRHDLSLRERRFVIFSVAEPINRGMPREDLFAICDRFGLDRFAPYDVKYNPTDRVFEYSQPPRKANP